MNVPGLWKERKWQQHLTPQPARRFKAVLGEEVRQTLSPVKAR